MTPSQEQAFSEFVAVDGDALLRRARLLFPDPHEAQDALQTALLRVARNWSKAAQAPAAYTSTTLRNLAVDGSRRRHLVAAPTGEEPVAAPTPDLAEAYAAADAVDALLSSLPPKQRVTVVLRVIDGLSEAEAAAELGCSTGTVKSNLSRGLASLRERMSTHETREATR